MISSPNRRPTGCPETSHLDLAPRPSDPAGRDRPECPRCGLQLPAHRPGRTLPGARSGGVKPPERTFRRSQLDLRLPVFYEDERLGMPRAASIPPSKPGHPREVGGRVVGTFSVPQRRMFIVASRQAQLPPPSDAHVGNMEAAGIEPASKCPSTDSSTCVAGCFALAGGPRTSSRPSPRATYWFRSSPSDAMNSDSMFMTPQPVNWPNPWKNWCGASRY